tara:strand:- start:5 stop:718 length:714 start_codon:yes stop_codon:yes gene_type:complete
VNPYMALYVKELKANRLVSAVLLVLTAAIVLAVITNASPLNATLPLLVLPYLSPPVFAGLLMNSISQEWSGNTQHQWLALPVPRAALPLMKLAAVGTLAVAVFVLNTFGVSMVLGPALEAVGEFAGAASGLPIVDVEAAVVWSVAGGVFGSMTVFLLGLALVAASLRMFVPRFKGLVTVSVFLGGFWLTGRLASTVSEALQSNWAIAEAHQSVLYLAGMGVLFAAVGAYVFDQHVDA